MGKLHVRTCSRTTRVTALRMGGSEVARWRDNLCCVRLNHAAGAHFATFIEQHFPSQVLENHCFSMGISLEYMLLEGICGKNISA